MRPVILFCGAAAEAGVLTLASSTREPAIPPPNQLTLRDDLLRRAAREGSLRLAHARLSGNDVSLAGIADVHTRSSNVVALRSLGIPMTSSRDDFVYGLAGGSDMLKQFGYVSFQRRSTAREWRSLRFAQ